MSDDPLEDRDDAIKEVADRRVLEELDEKSQLEQTRMLLQSEDFRDYLWRLIKRCDPLMESFDANFGKTGYNLGRQSVGRMLIAEINTTDPAAWRDMQFKAGAIAAQAAQAATLKKLRKSRSP